MTQESTNTPENAEKRKRLLLGGLFAILLMVLYWQFFSGDGDRPSTPVGANRPNSPNGPSGLVNSASGSATAETGATNRAARATSTPSPIVSMPLDLLAMTSKFAGSGAGRNIFVYPTPTPAPTPKPVPPPPPPPPPPVTLNGISPSGVIARTGDFNLAVFGIKIPSDVQIQIDGRPFETQFVSDSEARANIPGEVIRGGGNLNVTVRSKADPSLFSNQVTINVAEPPIPLYRYIGLIVTAQRKIAVLKEMDGEENVVNMLENSTFKCDKRTNRCKWKLVSITPQRLTIEDLDLRLTHTISFTGESGDDR